MIVTNEHGVTGLTGDMRTVFNPTGDTEIRGVVRTADPDDGSPGDDTWWVMRNGASPEDVQLKARVDGETIVLAPGVGSGDVIGPGSAVDGHLAVFDGTTGKLIKDGGVPGSAPAYKGAMVTKAADQNTANYTTAAAVTWDSETYDTDGFHESVTNPSRFTIPSGVTKVNISINIVLSNVTANDWSLALLEKNGSASFPGAAACFSTFSGTTRVPSVTAIGVPVVAGDYFEAFLQVGADTSISVVALRSFFTIQVVE